MPYIKQEWRDLVYPAVFKLEQEIERFESHAKDGVLNFAITCLLLDSIMPNSYTDFERIIGLLECIKLEIYRRRIAEYEDDKIHLYGDV